MVRDARETTHEFMLKGSGARLEAHCGCSLLLKAKRLRAKLSDCMALPCTVCVCVWQFQGFGRACTPVIMLPCMSTLCDAPTVELRRAQVSCSGFFIQNLSRAGRWRLPRQIVHTKHLLERLYSQDCPENPQSPARSRNPMTLNP